MKTNRTIATAALALAVSISPTIFADEVTDWNNHMLSSILTGQVGAAPASRVTATVQSAVYDAVNGVYRQYTPIHVAPAAPAGASARAAAVQAAYGVLIKQFPNQQVSLNQKRDASLAALDEDGDGVLGQSVQRGVAWGQQVADAIWTWRSTDGFLPPPPPFFGSGGIGEWRPTPPAFLPGALPQLAYTAPFVIDSVANFVPPGPNPVGTPGYEADLAEVEMMGRANSPLRSADETLLSRFWAGNTPGFWNRTATAVAERNGLSLLEKSRLLAAMNAAVADAVFSCWNSKYEHLFWRPVTVLQLTDPTWSPLLTTPNHPEYPSGHSSQSGAAAGVLAAFFGDATEFSIISETTPGVTRYFTSFMAAAEEAGDSRIFGGIHLRKSCTDGKALGIEVAEYVLQNAFQRVHGTTHFGNQ